MSDFLVAGLIVLALAAVANFGGEDVLSPGCKPSGWHVSVC